MSNNHGKNKSFNFDLQTFVEDLTNSLTDRLYRKMHKEDGDANQSLEEKFKKRKLDDEEEDGLNPSLPKYNLDIDNFDSLHKKVSDSIEEKLSQKIAKKIDDELDEQYHPESKLEEFFDISIQKMRYVMILSFIPIAFVLISISSVIIMQTYTLGEQSVKYIKVISSESYANKYKRELSNNIQIKVNNLQQRYEEINKITGGNTDIIKDKMAIKLMTLFENKERMLSEDNSRAIKDILNKIVAQILSILDMILIGSLVVMVLIGGYENTISRVGRSHSVPLWFGKLDIGHLKIKVAASIVIISSIHLLMSFMSLKFDMGEFNTSAIMWITIVHIVFVLSAMALAYMETYGHSPAE